MIHAESDGRHVLVTAVPFLPLFHLAIVDKVAVYSSVSTDQGDHQHHDRINNHQPTPSRSSSSRHIRIFVVVANKKGPTIVRRVNGLLKPIDWITAVVIDTKATSSRNLLVEGDNYALNFLHQNQYRRLILLWLRQREEVL